MIITQTKRGCSTSQHNLLFLIGLILRFWRSYNHPHEQHRISASIMSFLQFNIPVAFFALLWRQRKSSFFQKNIWSTPIFIWSTLSTSAFLEKEVIWSYGQHPHFYGQKLPKLFSIFCWLMSHYRPITHFCWVTHHFWCWKKSHDSTIQRWEITMGNHHGNPATSHFFPWCWWCWRWKSHKHHEIPLESYYNPLNPIKWWKSPL